MEDSKLIEFLVKLLKRKTLTPNECGIYDLIKDELSDFNIITHDKNNVKNIFLYKDFSSLKNNTNSKKKHLCFAGHVDVVPSGEGWSYPPFEGVIKDNIIYGRGTTDMKGGIASFIYAIKKIKQFDGIISILLTSDEEGDGIYGTKIMLEHLSKINLLPDFSIVAEPTSKNTLGDVIKIGRRGSINGTLIIKGIQGHVAYPNKCLNPIDLITPILPKLSNITLDNGDENFSESRIIITDIRAGMEVVNVTPSELKIMFNVRNNPHVNQDSLKEYIASIFGSIPYNLELKQSSYPFITKSKQLIESLSLSIKNVVNINPSLDTSGGTSDARYFSKFGVEVVELGLLNNKIHAVDECCRVDDVIMLKNIFYNFIANFK